jgi:predicted nucleic acid-binding protein
MIAIDTNILVYSIDRREPVKQPIAEKLLLRLSEDEDTKLIWQVLAEFTRWLTTAKQQSMITAMEMYGYLHHVRSVFPTVMPTPAVLDIALDLADRYSLSYWDSMLLGACIDAGTLYTEDIGAPRKIDSLELVNPF